MQPDGGFSALALRSSPASVHLTDIELMQCPVVFLLRRMLEVRGELQQFVTELGMGRLLRDLLAEFVEKLHPGVAAFRRAVAKFLLQKRNQVFPVHL